MQGRGSSSRLCLLPRSEPAGRRVTRWAVTSLRMCLEQVAPDPPCWGQAQAPAPLGSAGKFGSHT